VLTEDAVVAAACAHLEQVGWRIDSRALATQRGDDIVASRNGVTLTVEAKGAGSSKIGTSRYGREFTSSQVYISVAAAVLRALGVASQGSALAACAFPDNPAFRKTVGKGAVALARAGVGVFWVAEDGPVSPDLPW